MANKTFWVILAGCIVVVVSVVSMATDLLPTFLAPFVAVVYGMFVLYMSR